MFPWTVLDMKHLVPVVINHMNERFGLLTIIVIGEGIISLLYVETSLDKVTFVFRFFSKCRDIIEKSCKCNMLVLFV